MDATSMTVSDGGVESASSGPAQLASPFVTRPVQFFLVGLMVLGYVWVCYSFRPSGAVPTIDSAELRIDLNKATIHEISLMPGIGDTMARRILLDRQTHGPFASVADLARVPGIGPKTLAQIESMCHVPTPVRTPVSTPVSNDRLAARPN